MVGIPNGPFQGQNKLKRSNITAFLKAKIYWKEANKTAFLKAKTYWKETIKRPF